MSRPRVDYEEAWDRLQELILTRDGWGTRQLITEMAEIRLRCRIPDREDPSSEPAGTSPGEACDGHRSNEDPREDRDGYAGRGAGSARAAALAAG